MATIGSPFQCGGVAKTFPGKIFHKLTIRIDDSADTAKVFIRLGPDVVSSANAQYFLKAGEALEILGREVPDGASVSIIDSSDNPLIYWSMT